MFYFIPAWYRDGSWREREQNWHVRRMHSEFDDMVKYIQLFHRNQVADYEILLLGYSPNFRHFLHRQGVFRARYWSIFDTIQGIQRSKMRVLSYRDIRWPEGVAFSYTPYDMDVRLHGARYARIAFGEDGNPIEIEMFDQEVLKRRNVYDDRGFLSSSVLYQDGKAHLQEYYTENGTWKMRHYFTDDHVEINPEEKTYEIHTGEEIKVQEFRSLHYDRMEDLLLEVWKKYLIQMSKKDVFCVAAHPLHMNLVEKTLLDWRLILSFYEERFPKEEYESIRKILEAASYLVTDLRTRTIQLKKALSGKEIPVVDLSPYDTREDLGISQKMNRQKILFPVDQLENDIAHQALTDFSQYLRKNDKAELHIFTRDAREERRDELHQKIEPYFREIKEWESRVLIDSCVDEREVTRCMREQRLLVDLRQTPELYLQISTLSMGIPQINHVETQFVRDMENGRVLKDVKELPEALDFYLDGLKNWNDAEISAYNLGKKYSTPVLIEKWREVIKTVEQSDTE